MPTFNLNHIIAPFSRVIKWVNKKGPAFYVFPHNDDILEGWGKPHQLPDGTPVAPPGTPIADGGTDPIRRVGWDEDGSTWNIKKVPGNWLYGNIDWRGPVPATNISVKLSYHGPQARYFPEYGFSYGSDSKHNEIYIRGQYADIAPLPVLGAAYTTFVDPDTLEEIEYIVVMCKYYLDDILYMREKKATISPASMTSEIRSERMGLYSELTKPTGWREVLRVSRQTSNEELAGPALTPWFFSEDGQEVQCTRAFEKTFNNGVEIVTEVGLNRYKILINSPTNATFLNQRNTSGYTYTCDTTKTSYGHISPQCILPTGIYTSPQCEQCPQPNPLSGDDSRHYFAVDSFQQQIEQTGQYVVGVDYYEDTEILLYCKHDMRREYDKWYRYCIDSLIGGASYPFGTADGDYHDVAVDGWRWQQWSWWLVNEEWDTSLGCLICDLYGGDIEAYYAAGGTSPPDTARSSEEQVPRYVLDDEISLKWTHPTGGPQEVFVYQAQQGKRDRTYGFAVLDPSILDSRYTFTAYVQYLDIRIPEGPFMVARTETIKRDNIGLVKSGRPGYSGFTRGTTGSDQYHHDYWWYRSGSDTKEEITYEIIDPYTDPTATKVLSIEEGKEFFVLDDIENMDLDAMQAWNPTGADTIAQSTNEPNSVNGITGHDWRRNDFAFQYSVYSFDGHMPTKQDFTDANLEPHSDDWTGEALGDTPWPSYAELFTTAKNVSEYGFAWELGVGVCISIPYEKSFDAGGLPAEKPITAPGSFPQVYYLNYITNGDLEQLVAPADRFYPIGVE